MSTCQKCPAGEAGKLIGAKAFAGRRPSLAIMTPMEPAAGAMVSRALVEQELTLALNQIEAEMAALSEAVVDDVAPEDHVIVAAVSISAVVERLIESLGER